MKGDGHELSSIYITGHFLKINFWFQRNGEAELAFTLFGEAKRDRVLPNIIMCRCLTGDFVNYLVC